MANTDDSNLYQQYLINYIEDMKTKLNQLEMKLDEQSQLYTITFVPIDQMDYCLKEFVNCQRKYLLTRNNKQLGIFKDNMKGHELFEIITTYYPTIDQVSKNFLEREIIH